MKKRLVLEPEKEAWTQARTSDNPENVPKVTVKDFQQRIATRRTDEEFVS